MSPRAFADLTPSGQVRRLRALALDALREYDLEVRRCTFVARAFNTVFRVDAADGSTYALRVSPHLRIHAEGCEEAEAAWLAELGVANLDVPRVIPARDGSAVVWVGGVGVPELRSCVLFEWIGGRQLRDDVRADLVRKTGALTARVHEHAVAYASEPPRGVLVADRVLYLRGENRLEGLRSTYGAVLTDAVERAQDVLDELWRNPPHPPHQLHGDVHPGNDMVARGRIVLIDFQDLIWGFETQDVGIAVLWLDSYDGSAALSAAFRAGYESVRPWPDAKPDTIAALAAARHLNVLNFGLGMGGSGMDEFVARHAAPVAEWMGG